MSAQMVETNGRTVGGTEHSWCRAVPGGTGIAVLAILTSEAPKFSHLQTALQKLQKAHPILKSRLVSNPNTDTFSFLTSPTPFVQIKFFDLSSTYQILQKYYTNPTNETVSPFQLILEHELNQNCWQNPSRPSSTTSDMFFATTYVLPNTKCVVVFRLHVSACDRTTAASLLRELLMLMEEEGAGSNGGVQKEIVNKGKVSLGIEDLIPNGKAKNPLWARGVNMLSYSVNSLGLTNLKFKDSKSPRSSNVVRLQLDQNDTETVLAGCKTRGIKLCGAVTAAGLLAVHSTKPKRSSKKYGTVTLTDCRSVLDPPLSTHNFGFYHSAILNIHEIKGGESFWELAKKTYGTFANSKNSNKHFTDMADLNFLMVKAIDNPGLTSSSSLRTSIMSVFEDPVIDLSSEKQKEIGLEDYMGCASIHGVGPSIAIFDTIRDGRLDCVCVYPTPLHSREQMQELVDNMKAIIVEAGNVHG
ncbi:GATA zinc finger protein [Quillaja saponaria]|uniref:GATA zinc finger protein n=1 Tax=Quillaja saponaria TaxID=32244 RepID=A0AAD7PYL8_QUISA|nr:GATA zinc finger protein [Quillaja saponaria]